MPTEALKTLHTALIDAGKGYEEAIKDADAPGMKAMFEKMRALHHQAHSDIDGILVAKGEQPDESGSFMSTVHETVVSVRSAVTGLNPSSLGSFASGEERIVKDYDNAIEENGADPAVVAKLQGRRQELLGAIAEMKQQAA